MYVCVIMDISELKVGQLVRCKKESYADNSLRLLRDPLTHNWRVSLLDYETHFYEEYSILDEDTIFTYVERCIVVTDENNYIFSWNDYRFLTLGKKVYIHEQDIKHFEPII